MQMRDKSLLIDRWSPDGEFRVTFEDDGKVAYGYLKQQDDIVGDVWLYNRCTTPTAPEWTDRSKIPFANCCGYASEQGRLQEPVENDDVQVEWEYEGDQPTAYIYVREELLGVVGIGDKPGYSRWAVKDGPLGRVMQFED
jgi:hypothetical protein